jgi:hypothetical protein
MSERLSVRYQFINNTKTCSFIQTLTFSPKSISKVVFLSLSQANMSYLERYRNRNRNKFINQIRAPGGHIQITIMIDTQQQHCIDLFIRSRLLVNKRIWSTHFKLQWNGTCLSQTLLGPAFVFELDRCLIPTG